MQSAPAMSQTLPQPDGTKLAVCPVSSQGLIYGIQGRGRRLYSLPDDKGLFGGWLGARTAVSWPSPAPTVISPFGCFRKSSESWRALVLKP